jgi:hypothetical protein|nr:MAG TPA: hypothetical protein [Caudoviricetes sp.]
MHIKVVENNYIHKIMYLIESSASVRYYKKLKIVDISCKKKNYSINNIDKVIKTKTLLLFISNKKIYRAMNDIGFIGTPCYKDNDAYIRINTYTMLRKLKSEKKEVILL